MSDWQEILGAVANKYSVTLKDLSSEKRNRNLVMAREEASFKLADNKCPLDKLANLLNVTEKEARELIETHKKRMDFRRKW